MPATVVALGSVSASLREVTYYSIFNSTNNTGFSAPFSTFSISSDRTTVRSDPENISPLNIAF